MSNIVEPQIYVINNEKIADRLKDDFTVGTGDLGLIKEIHYGTYKEHAYFNLEYNLDSNLHEYKVIIIDLEEKRKRKIISVDEQVMDPPYMIRLGYPNNVFDPAPFMMKIITSRMRNNPHETIRIIFSDLDFKCTFDFVEVSGQKSYSYVDTVDMNLYNTISTSAIKKTGEITKCGKGELAETIYKYVDGYNTVFDLPGYFDRQSKTMKIDKNYVPLIYNGEDQVVSYLGFSKTHGYELLLPQCKDKEKLVTELCTQVLPRIFPSMFPESKEFAWINSPEFEPKEIKEIQFREQEYMEEHKKRMDEFTREKEDVYMKNKFLLDLLTGSGDDLVLALKTYFDWLGFDNISLPDGSEEILREDMQIIDGDDMFIIEIKGIGGTSTDAECAQIIKHRRRREKENSDKKIFPIYIVNHQRYINPKQRKNPPFTDNQIDYAKSDERGLLSTWQLFQQYKLVEDGVFTKEETKSALKKTGLITLESADLKFIGKVKEYFKKPRACIFDLKETEITVGDIVWAQKGDFWRKGIIQSIELDDKPVESAKNGEVGMVLDIDLDTGYELYVK